MVEQEAEINSSGSENSLVSANERLIDEEDDQNYDVQDATIFGQLLGLISLNELLEVIRLGLPIVTAMALQMLLGVINLYFVGHIDKSKLAAAALATTFCNVTGFSVFVGMLTAADTLCSQAFGANNFRRVGIVAQRSFWILLILAVPIAFLWWHSGLFLLLARQEQHIIVYSQLYTRLMVPSLLFSLIFEILRRYLQAQSIVYPVLIANACAIVACLTANYLLVIYLGLGFIGAPIAMCFASFTGAFVLLGVIVSLQLHKKTWFGWDVEGFRGWKEFLLLGLPGVGMVCFEWWTFEIQALLAGLISVTALASQSVIITLTSLTFMIPLGLGLASSVRVGNLLGANKPILAKKASFTILLATFIIMLFMSLFMYSLRDYSPKIITDDPSVISLVSHIMPLISIFMTSDGLQAVFGGVLRGSGRQKVGAFANMLAYYVFGIPLSVFFAFYLAMNLAGLWLGLLAASLTICSIYIAVFALTDWHAQAAIAIAAAKSDNNSNNIAEHV